MRPIAAMKFPGLIPGQVGKDVPEFIWIDPAKLLVDETYQRELSRKSLDLISRIITKWDWARMKPPVVALTDDGYEVIDGQHTAIAAATHPGIKEIPVMVVGADDLSQRAAAFVGHNRDRIALSQIQIHYANVLAGDEDALTVQQVCERAGCTLVRYPPGNTSQFKPGDTIAIASIRGLVNRRGAMGARIVLQVLADAHCAPVRADAIKAVDTLLHDAEYRGQVSAKDLTAAFMKLGPAIEPEAKLFAATHSVPIWRALVVVVFKEARRGRRKVA